MNPAGKYNDIKYDYGTNIGGWLSSAMWKNLNDIDEEAGDDWFIYMVVLEKLMNGIINTYVVSSHDYSDLLGELKNDNYESIDKLYLLSPEEVYGISLIVNMTL